MAPQCHVLSEVVELLSVALRAVLALAAIAFCLFSSVVQVTFIIFSMCLPSVIPIRVLIKPLRGSPELLSDMCYI